MFSRATLWWKQYQSFRFCQVRCLPSRWISIRIYFRKLATCWTTVEQIINAAWSLQCYCKVAYLPDAVCVIYCRLITTLFMFQANTIEKLFDCLSSDLRLEALDILQNLVNHVMSKMTHGRYKTLLADKVIGYIDHNCVCVCVCVYVYICKHSCLYVHTHTHTCVNIETRLNSLVLWL